MANYLKRQVVGFEISDRLIEEFVGWGNRPRGRSRRSRPLQVSTAGMPAPVPAESEAKAVPRQQPPPSEEEQRRIIEQARHLARGAPTRTSYPTMSALQVTRRYFDPDWHGDGLAQARRDQDTR